MVWHCLHCCIQFQNHVNGNVNANHVNQKCRNRQQKDRECVTYRSEKNRRYGSSSEVLWWRQRSYDEVLLISSWTWKSHHLAPRPFAFTRLIQRFDATGGVTVRLKDPETVITPENIENVKQYFTEKPRCGIREGCDELDLSYAQQYGEFCVNICIGKRTNHGKSQI